jgi:hypothetical protein
MKHPGRIPAILNDYTLLPPVIGDNIEHGLQTMIKTNNKGGLFMEAKYVDVKGIRTRYLC